MLVFQACRMQELWGQEGFHPDFEGKPRRPDNVIGSPWEGKTVKMKPKLHWRPQDVGNASNMECLLRKAIGNKWSQPKQCLCGLRMARSQVQGCPNLLEFTLRYHVPWTPDMMLQDLMGFFPA
jgi:hypothetical protein